MTTVCGWFSLYFIIQICNENAVRHSGVKTGVKTKHQVTIDQ